MPRPQVRLVHGWRLNVVDADRWRCCGCCRATLPALREKHADYVSDLGKFRTHLEQVQSHREAMATKVAKRQAELSEIERQLETVLEEVRDMPRPRPGT